MRNCPDITILNSLFVHGQGGLGGQTNHKKISFFLHDFPKETSRGDFENLRQKCENLARPKVFILKTHKEELTRFLKFLKVIVCLILKT